MFRHAISRLISKPVKTVSTLFTERGTLTIKTIHSSPHLCCYQLRTSSALFLYKSTFPVLPTFSRINHIPHRATSNQKTSTGPSNPGKQTSGNSNEDLEEKSLTLYQRFKTVYKEYGKTLIGVHVVTSIAWYGAFYMIAQSGIDLLPILQKLGAGESLQQKYTAAGDFLVAYLLYEVAKPVRYLATLAGTRQMVLYLRKTGYIPLLKEEDKLRNLAREGRENIREKYQESKENFKERTEGMRVTYERRRSLWRRKWVKQRRKWRPWYKHTSAYPPKHTAIHPPKYKSPGSKHR